MPRLGFGFLCLWLALVMSAGVGWSRTVAAASLVVVEATTASIGPERQTHEEERSAPALPPDPSPDGESSDGEGEPAEYDSDTPERMVPLWDEARIPPAGCAGRLGASEQLRRAQTGPTGLFRPPRA